MPDAKWNKGSGDLRPRPHTIKPPTYEKLWVFLLPRVFGHQPMRTKGAESWTGFCMAHKHTSTQMVIHDYTQCSQQLCLCVSIWVCVYTIYFQYIILPSSSFPSPPSPTFHLSSLSSFLPLSSLFPRSQYDQQYTKCNNTNIVYRETDFVFKQKSMLFLELGSEDNPFLAQRLVHAEV